jgi:hypothetical protein
VENVIRKLSKEKPERNVGKEKSDPKKGRAFRNAKMAVGFTTVLGVAGCGVDTLENQILVVGDERPVSEMCVEENVTLEARSNQVSVDQGQTFVFPNGYKMTLTDIEAETQTALFELKDSDGNVVRHVDMEEGVEYTIVFPDGDVNVAACSVRAGYTFGEKSVTLRASVDVSIEEEQQTVDPVCDVEVEVQTSTHMYNYQFSYAMQTVEDQYCEGELVVETSSFDPDIETLLNEGGAVTGLPEGRYTVLVFGEEYVLAQVDAGGITLAKEAVSGIVNQGESLPVDDLRFQLDDLEVHGDTINAIVSVLDAMGNVLQKDKVSSGQTKTFNIQGTDYHLHVYMLAPGYTFGAKWADMAIFSEITDVREGGEMTTGSGNYTFGMDWGTGGMLQGWQFQRSQ